jgi:microcystin-dependent protein
MPENNDNVGASLELEVPNFFTHVKLTSIDDVAIDVYKNSKNDFSYTPLLLVDWIQFKQNLDLLDQTATEILEIPILLRFKNDKVDAELRTAIRSLGVVVSNLTVLPHTFFKLTAKIGGADQILNASDIPVSEDGISLTRKYNITTPQMYRVRGKIAELHDFYKWRGLGEQLRGELYSDGFTYTSNYIKALATFLSDTSIRKELVGDESIIDKTIVKNSTSGVGASISFPGISIGGGATSNDAESEKFKKRFLNRNYISDFLSSYKSKLSIEATASPEQIKYVLDNLVTRLFDLGSKVSVEFKKLEADEYALIVAEADYTRIGKIKVQDVLKYKPDFEKIDDQKGKIKVDGIEISVEKNNTYKNKDDVEWMYNGEMLIPTKVNMVLLSDSRLSNEFDFSSMLISKDGRRSTVTKFIYPSVWLADNSSKVTQPAQEISNPIGAIVAFAGSKTEQPPGWELCDGKLMNSIDYIELFKIIGYRWGKGINEGEFMLPNLEGVFLRGTDYSKVVDPDVGVRSNSMGETGEVGSFQSDTLQNITGNISGIKCDNNGLGADGAFTPAAYTGDGDGGESRTCFNVSFNAAKVVRTSSETRPKNAYVNYLIRAK